jgi:dTMP kinase
MGRNGGKAGILITFEGTEGAGKSTLIGLLDQRLSQAGVRCVRTREPGGSPVAEKIRALLLGEAMDPWTELFLYEAARAEHLARTVRPALERGDVVLCDRFTDSSLAYQAHARGLPWKEVVLLNRSATRGLKPDLTVWLDVDPAVGLSRASERNRFEDEGVAFQRKVRQGFVKASRQPGRSWLKINARSGTPEQLADRVWQALSPRLRRAKKLD